jgi:hypothetical protein
VKVKQEGMKGDYRLYIKQERLSTLPPDERKPIRGTRSTKQHEEKGCPPLIYKKILRRVRMFGIQT